MKPFTNIIYGIGINHTYSTHGNEGAIPMQTERVLISSLAISSPDILLDSLSKTGGAIKNHRNTFPCNFLFYSGSLFMENERY